MRVAKEGPSAERLNPRGEGFSSGCPTKSRFFVFRKLRMIPHTMEPRVRTLLRLFARNGEGMPKRVHEGITSISSG